MVMGILRCSGDFSALSVRGGIAGGTEVTTCATASGVSPV
jgi:hypothetical protein